MNKNTLLAVGGLVIVVILGVLLFSNNAAAPANDAGDAQNGMATTEENQDQETTEAGNQTEQNNQNAQPSPGTQQPTTPEKVTISYTDSGYSPANVTVPVNTTVVFKNNSSKNIWVASAPHPTHTDYPEFDAKKAIAPGQTYEFTFTKTGTWRYHDHLAPNFFGSVTVE